MQSAVDEINDSLYVVKGTVLYNNTSTSFPAQTLTFSDSYAYVKIEFDESLVVKFASTEHNGAMLARLEPSTNALTVYGRNVKFTGNSIIFGSGYYWQNNTQVQNNTVFIPKKIIGYKQN